MANLKIKNLQKGFEGFSIIKGIDLEVNDKEFVVFVGPSGCGKSTLLRLIAGLEEVSGGTIELDGRDITEVSPAKRDLAMVFQTYALYPHMSVRKNMSFALDLAGVPKAEVEKKVGEAARILELGPMLERKPKQLSAASVNAWPSAAPSCATRKSSCSTNRCPTLMLPCACRCVWNCCACTRSCKPR